MDSNLCFFKRNLYRYAASQDLSWYNAALKWEKVFEWAKIDPPHCSPSEHCHNNEWHN